MKAIFNIFQKPKSEIIVTMENTGRYNWEIYQVLEYFNFKVFDLNPLHLKKSIGLIWGKNDNIDAKWIC
ncbi:IS110 family transposase, partial [Chryseobacterium cucumeris]